MAGLIMTGQAMLTPLLMVIVMIAGDFLAMSLTMDNVRATRRAECMADRRIDDRRFILGSAWWFLLCGAPVGTFVMVSPLPALQTLAFVTLVFGSQAMIYAIRGRPHLWSVRPSLCWLGRRSWTWRSPAPWQSPESPRRRCQLWW